jgi:hypothetical protein
MGDDGLGERVEEVGQRLLERPLEAGLRRVAEGGDEPLLLCAPPVDDGIERGLLAGRRLGRDNRSGRSNGVGLGRRKVGRAHDIHELGRLAQRCVDSLQLCAQRC